MELVNLGRLEDADAAFARVLQINPQNAWAWMERGHARASLADPSAIAFYERAVDVAPNLDVAHYYLGMEYLRLRELELAGRELEHATRTNPENQMFREGFEAVQRARAEFRNLSNR